ERGLVELMQGSHDREPADEFRDQAVPNQVLRLHALQGRPEIAGPRGLDVGLEAEGLLSGPALDDLFQADERAATDEEDVRRIDLEELLVRVLASALRRDVGDGPFEDLQQRLLDALTRDVAGDGGVLVLAADLVDFVDVDDALLALLDVAAGGLQQFEDDVLD